MKISHNWLQSFFDKKLPNPKELADILMMHSFETEVEGDILDADILPNRSHDCLSHMGIAREVSSVTEIKLKDDLNYSIKGDLEKSSVDVDLQGSGLCSRYMALSIKGVKISPSPKWLQERLESVGVIPRNNIVDITNFVMLEIGQPMHAFDADKLESNKIIIRRAKEGENFTSLDGESHKLDGGMLVIADERVPLALAGIKGGKKAEITDGTKNIILESANFNSASTRLTSKKVNIRTESSIRFEAELDPNLAEVALARAASLVTEIAKGEIKENSIDVYEKKVLPKKINLDYGQIASVLGVDVPKKDVLDILTRLHFKYSDVKKKINDREIPITELQVEVPTIRRDIEIVEDVIEEIGRVYGYEKIVATPPMAPITPAGIDDDLYWHNKLKLILPGIGFNESLNYSFISEEDNDFLNFKKTVPLINPLSKNHAFLRPFLMINLLKNVKTNFKNFDKVKLFEIGRTFRLHGVTGNVHEHYNLSGVSAAKDKNFNKDGFYNLKGTVEHLIKGLGVSDVWYDDAIDKKYFAHNIFQDGVMAQIKVGDTILGFIGRVDSGMLNYFGIKNDVFAFELHLGELVQIANEETIYTAPSVYPEIVRDVSLFVDQKVKIVNILNVANRVGKEMIRDIDLFDIYEGDVNSDQKSLAFHVIYGSDVRTLTDEEVNKVHKKVERALEEELGAKIRK